MTRRSRRTILCGTAGLFALSAGCLDEAGLSDDNADGIDDESDPDEDDTGSAANGEPDDEDESGVEGLELEDYEAVAFELDRPREPDATLLADADRAQGLLADRGLDEDPYTGFVEETPFDESVLIALEADAPRLDYELALETVAVRDENEGEGEDGDESERILVVEAAVREEPESGDVGGTQRITVGQLVRATFAGSPATEARVTIVDDDGTSHEMRLDVDGASESGGD